MVDIPVLDESTLALDPERNAAEEGLALCLSGGGYRAMLFHLGTLWRLNQLGVLPKLDRVSSVSGGSITAAVLGLHWSRLEFDTAGIGQAFQAAVATPILALADETIDVESVLGGIFLPGSVADKVRNALRKHLFGDSTLQALPDRPRFVINATSLQSGALFRFSKPYIWDYRVGKVSSPTVTLAAAVQASAAFPPVLAPARMEFPPGAFTPGTGTDLEQPPFTREVYLVDGGVYDNLGIETAWKRCRTVMVSDAGGTLRPDEDPPANWLGLLTRVTATIDNQVRSLRKRQIVAAFKNGRPGAYWSIRCPNIGKYPAPPGGLPDPDPLRTRELADVDTRLARLPRQLQERLVNWGYTMTDIAYRAHIDTSAPAPAESDLPYPGTPI